MVERIEELRAKLQPCAFAKPEVLLDSDIPVVRSRTKDNVGGSITVHRDLHCFSRHWVSNRLLGRGGEATGIVPNVNGSHGFRQVPVTDAIGVITNWKAGRKRKATLQSEDRVHQPSTQCGICNAIPAAAELFAPAHGKLPASAEAESMPNIEIGG